jgi:hypothetical protein
VTPPMILGIDLAAARTYTGHVVSILGWGN